MVNKSIISATCACLAVISFNVNAVSTVINVTDSGWYNPDIGHLSDNTNYAAGPNDTYRNFFIFDLSGISGIVTSATLSLETDPNWINGTPNYEIYDVTTDISTLVTSHSTGTTTNAIHDDLGSGVLYGSGAVTNATNMFDFTLNSSAETSITDAIGGLWALGGRNSLLDDSYAFWNTGSGIADYTRQLIIETTVVPIPAALWLFGSGLLGLIGIARRKTRP